VEILGRFGFEFTIIDCEHGILNFETAENLVRAANASGIIPWVRVPENNKKMINYGLEIGAQRIIVPDIRTASEVAQAILWTTYQHNGRGASPFCRDTYERRPLNQTWTQFENFAHANTGIIALIENREAIPNIESIISVPGLRGVMIGPLDFSVSCGWSRDTIPSPELDKILEKVVEFALKYNVEPIIALFGDLESNATQLEKWKRKGVTYFSVGCDKSLLGENADRYIKLLKNK